MISYILAAVTVVGAILNIKQRKSGFVVWLGSDICWIVVDYRAEIYGQAVLFAFFAGLCVWGLWDWQKKKLPW